MIRAKRPGQFDAIGTDCRRHFGADVLGELNGEGADAAGARVDQDLLTLLEFEVLEQDLPGGQSSQGYGSRSHEVNYFRLRRDKFRVNGDIFGISSSPQRIEAHRLRRLS